VRRHSSSTVVAVGLEVLLQAARRPPNLILLDIQMPFADGLRTARGCWNTPGLGRYPVTLVTARTDDIGCCGHTRIRSNFLTSGIAILIVTG
jgi:CheY-like chemotaxis protein